MVRLLRVDRPNQQKFWMSPADKSRYERKKARKEKLEKRLEQYRHDGVGTVDDETVDRVTEWVDEDFDRMDIDLIEEEQFCNDLAGDFDIPIQKTGTRYYHNQKPLGRFIKSIRESNSENNKTTILIIRGVNEGIYRLGIERGEETTVLSSAIRKGYILSEIRIERVDT